MVGRASGEQDRRAWNGLRALIAITLFNRELSESGQFEFNAQKDSLYRLSSLFPGILCFQEPSDMNEIFPSARRLFWGSDGGNLQRSGYIYGNTLQLHSRFGVSDVS